MRIADLDSLLYLHHKFLGELVTLYLIPSISSLMISTSATFYFYLATATKIDPVNKHLSHIKDDALAIVRATLLV
jgi:aspartyl/asparaginyl beta-hydroxylase (cupin superfamily)